MDHAFRSLVLIKVAFKLFFLLWGRKSKAALNRKSAYENKIKLLLINCSNFFVRNVDAILWLQIYEFIDRDLQSRLSTFKVLYIFMSQLNASYF